MSPERILYLLKDAELRAGELYSQIGLSQSVSRPALSDLFNELAEGRAVSPCCRSATHEGLPSP